MRVLIAEHVAKQIKKLDPALKERLRKALDFLSENPELGKRLEDELKGLQSYRISKYRIIYKSLKKEGVLYVTWFSHRADVYDEVKRILKAGKLK